MKKSIRKGIVVAILGAMILTGCTANERVRKYGGSMTMDLPAGEKLLEVTWKDDDSLFYLTRPMREDETAETYKFKQKSPYGIVEGTVTIVEHNK